MSNEIFCSLRSHKQPKLTKRGKAFDRYTETGPTIAVIFENIIKFGLYEKIEFLSILDHSLSANVYMVNRVILYRLHHSLVQDIITKCCTFWVLPFVQLYKLLHPQCDYIFEHYNDYEQGESHETQYIFRDEAIHHLLQSKRSSLPYSSSILTDSMAISQIVTSNRYLKYVTVH